MGNLPSSVRKPKIALLEVLLKSQGLKIKASEAEQFWELVLYFTPWMTVMHIFDPDVWHRVATLTRKAELQGEKEPPLTLYPILSAILQYLGRPGDMVPVMAAAVEEKKACTVAGNLVEKSETKLKQNGTDRKEDKGETLPECCKPEGKEIREGWSVPSLGTQHEVREQGMKPLVPSLGTATRSLWPYLVARGPQKLYPDLASLREALPSEHEEPPLTYSTWPQTD
jgi:hypothetical protein